MTGASDLAAVLSEGANTSWVSDCEEERQRKKNRGDFAELMCDRKSSRRHAGKRESSSRTSESGSRSADGAAPEIPIVIPDGKEFRKLLDWVFVDDLPVDETIAASSLLLWDVVLHTSDRLLHAELSWAAFTGNVSSLLTIMLHLLVVGAAALSTCLCELCHLGCLPSHCWSGLSLENSQEFTLVGSWSGFFLSF